MTVDDLARLYDYSYWVNRRLFPVVSSLTTEAFTQSIGGSYGSVRNTMVHVLSAEWGWLSRCGGPERGPALKADDFPTAASVIDTWATVERSMRAFLAALKDDDLARMVEFALPGLPPRRMAVGGLLQHGAIHGVHHRGQIALLLRMLGHAPGNFDLLLYDIDRQAAS
jgi:uncharacterized damage-inducible protein DinB